MRTAAQDAIVRLALGMWAADTRSTITPAQRDWIRARLQQKEPEEAWRPFTAHEKARIKEGLLDYIATYHPRITAIVSKQFLEAPHAR